jgi:hypothetical protein
MRRGGGKRSIVSRRDVLKIAAGGLAVLARPPAAPAQPRGLGAPGGRDAAVEAWRKYTQCQLSRQYALCFPHISTDARRRWAEQGRKAAAQYAEAKASEEIWFRRFQLIDVKIEGERAILTVRVEGGGDHGEFRERVEYLLVREDGGWKIDAIRERQTLYLP